MGRGEALAVVVGLAALVFGHFLDTRGWRWFYPRRAFEPWEPVRLPPREGMRPLPGDLPRVELRRLDERPVRGELEGRRR